jgi:hypothetical protein
MEENVRNLSRQAPPSWDSYLRLEALVFVCHIGIVKTQFHELLDRCFGPFVCCFIGPKCVVYGLGCQFSFDEMDRND